MDTKEEKEENKEHQLCSDLNQSSSKNRIKAIISYNIKGIIIVALIIAFMVYLFMDKDNKIRQIFAEKRNNQLAFNKYFFGILINNIFDSAVK